MALKDILSVVIPLLVVGVVLLRMSRPRHLRLPLLLILPVLVSALILSAVVVTPHAAFAPAAYASFAAALLLGAVAGYWRGRSVAIEVDGQGRVIATASRAAVLLILGLFAVRYLLRSEAATMAATWHVDPAVIVDTLMIFAVGMIAASRGEMFVRARRKLAARAAYA